MAQPRINGLFLAACAVVLLHQASATRLLTAGPGLAGGLTPYLQYNKQYSLFMKIAQKLEATTSYEDNTQGWAEGPTNQTVLLVADETLRNGFAQLATQYKINDPDTFVDRLIDIADGSTDPRQGTSPTFSKANYAAIALIAFADSHTLPQPHDFYSDDNIDDSPYETPVNVSTGIQGFYSYTGNLQAYAAANAPGPLTVYLRQEGGLQHATDGLAVPRNFVTATDSQSGATLNVYELDGIFVYGDIFGPADVTGYSGDIALTYLAQNGI